MLLGAVGLLFASQVPVEKRLQAIAAEMSRLGFEVDLSKVSVETRKRSDSVDAFERQQNLLFPPSYFAGMVAVVHAFGSTEPLDADSLRRQTAGLLADTFDACYLVGERRLLILEPEPDDELLTHELTHAWQDQRRGLESVLRRGTGSGARSVEAFRLTQCLAEGEAQLVAAAAALARVGSKLDALSNEGLEGMTLGLLGSPSLEIPYAEGRRFLFARYRDGGWPAVARAFTSPPRSTEQLMHPEKLGSDSPCTVDLPELPKGIDGATLVHEDVIGELGIRAHLVDRTCPAQEARLAAIGWDGDRLKVWRGPGGGLGMAWRTVWDREEDARAFANAVDSARLRTAGLALFLDSRSAPQGEGRVVVRGRTCDWIWAEDPILLRALEETLAAAKSDAACDPGDADSTARVEARWLARESRVEGGRWWLPTGRLSLRVPEGWSAGEISGIPYVLRTAENGFKDNLNALVLPNLDRKDASGLLLECETELRRTPGLSVDRVEKATIGGREVAIVEYRNRPSGRAGPLDGAPPLHMLCIVVPAGDRQIVLTATIEESRWDESKPVVWAAFRSIEFDPPGPESRER